MQIVISRKITSLTADKALDLTSLATALAVAGTGVTVKSFLNPEDTKKYIDAQTAKGYACHRFDFVASYKTETTTGIYPHTASVSPLRAAS